MLVTFLARLAREGSGQREMEKEEVEEAKVSWREGDIAHGVGTVAGSRRDVASGNDVDGRLSLSSANNIQHRPVYTHPITSTKLSPCAQATVEKRLVYEERDGSRARVCVCACVYVCRCLYVCARKLPCVVSYTGIIVRAQRPPKNLFARVSMYLSPFRYICIRLTGDGYE